MNQEDKEKLEHVRRFYQISEKDWAYIIEKVSPKENEGEEICDHCEEKVAIEALILRSIREWVETNKEYYALDKFHFVDADELASFLDTV